VRVRLDADRPAGVLVSGGLDSAAIVCTAASAGDVFGITYGLQDGGSADESRYTDALRAQGLRIEHVPFYPTTDADGITQSVIESETPAIDQVTLTLARAAQQVRAAGAQSLMLGTWGDQVLSPFPPPHIAAVAPWRTGELARLARAYRQYMTDVDEADIYRAFVRRSLRRRAPGWWLKRRRNQARTTSRFDVLAREFAPPRLEPHLRSFGAAVLRSVTSRSQLQAVEGTTKWGTENGVDARLPFLDVPLVRFLASLPDQHAYRGNALKPMLRDGMRTVVPPIILDRRDKGDYTAAIARGAPRAAALLEQLGDLRELVEFDLMSRTAAAKTLAYFRQSSEIEATSQQLAQLMGVSAWLRRFFGSKP
jgi:asparagine synthase (glutamine-hydrolysing)